MMTSFLLLALKSLLVAAVTLGLLRVNARRSAAERSTIAHLGLFALVALPLASLALPPLSIALPAPVAEHIQPATTGTPATIAAAPLSATDAAAAAPDSGAMLAGWAEALAPYAYILPVAALLALICIGLLRLVSLRSRAQVLVEPSWLSALARAQRRMGFKNGTALLVSDDLSSPISWGLMRPTILLNQGALDASEQAEAVIAHELAHVIHGDWAKLMLARLATAAFWFNPLAWVLAREAHQLREEAADDAVLAADISGPDYAELLVGVARHEARTYLLTAHGVAPSRNSLRRRIARVLDASPARHVAGRSWVAGFTMGMLVMAAPLAAVTFAQSTATAAPDTIRPSPVEAARDVAVAQPAGAGGLVSAPRARVGVPFVPAAHVAAAARALPLDHPVADHSASATVSVNVADVVAVSAKAPEVSVHTPVVDVRTKVSPSVALAALPQAGPWSAPRPMPSARPATSRSDTDVDRLIQMRALHITSAFKQDLADAGFPNLTVDELVQARSLGVTGSYIREMRSLGMQGGFQSFVQARAVGLNTDYVREMKAAGINATFSEYHQMRAVGVSPKYVRALRAHGLTVTAASKLIQLKAVGFDPENPNDLSP